MILHSSVLLPILQRRGHTFLFVDLLLSFSKNYISPSCNQGSDGPLFSNGTEKKIILEEKSISFSISFISSRYDICHNPPLRLLS